MLIVNVDPVETRPESKPPGVLAEALAAKYVHGCAKDDWVTECGIVLRKQRQNPKAMIIARYHLPSVVERDEGAHRRGKVGWTEDFPSEANINL